MSWEKWSSTISQILRMGNSIEEVGGGLENKNFLHFGLHHRLADDERKKIEWKKENQ